MSEESLKGRQQKHMVMVNTGAHIYQCPVTLEEKGVLFPSPDGGDWLRLRELEGDCNVLLSDLEAEVPDDDLIKYPETAGWFIGQKFHRVDEISPEAIADVFNHLLVPVGDFPDDGETSNMDVVEQEWRDEWKEQFCEYCRIARVARWQDDAVGYMDDLLDEGEICEEEYDEYALQLDEKHSEY